MQILLIELPGLLFWVFLLALITALLLAIRR